jgi:hypothetical protein
VRYAELASQPRCGLMPLSRVSYSSPIVVPLEI